MLAYINWDINPVIFRLGGFAVRYYSLMFAAAFLIGYYILAFIFKKENVPNKLLQNLLIYVFVGTITGARLGQVLFYEFAYYKNHITEMLLPFHFTDGKFEFTGYQGLASHGAAMGILITVAIYCKKYKQSFLWIIDRLVIVIAISGFFIRIGNLFNSEIIGKPTNVSWAFIFERVDLIPRHPVQLYESVSYLLIFAILWKTYSRRPYFKRGFLFGLFLILLFSFRFIIEFLKENQETFENLLPINMGQILSLPFIFTGFYFVLRRTDFPTKQLQLVMKRNHEVNNSNMFIVVEDSETIKKNDLIQLCNLQEFKCALDEGRDPECEIHRSSDFIIVDTVT